MTQKALSKIGISDAVTISPVTTIVPEKKTNTNAILGTKFTVFAMAFNTLGLVAVTFASTAFSGNIMAADLVLGSSLVCLTGSLFSSQLNRIKEKLGRFK